MAETNKTVRITKVQRFADIKAMLHGEPVAVLEDGTPRTTLDDADKFIDHEVELVSKKNTSGNKKSSKTQQANEGYKAEIMDFMRSRVKPDGTQDDSGMTCTAIGHSIPTLVDAGFGTSKFSSLCNALVNEGLLVKKSVKGETLFSLA